MQQNRNDDAVEAPENPPGSDRQPSGKPKSPKNPESNVEVTHLDEDSKVKDGIVVDET